MGMIYAPRPTKSVIVPTAIPVPINEALLAEAKRLAKIALDNHQFTMETSIRHGDGILTGKIGELAARAVVGGRHVAGYSYHLDLLLDDGRRLEIKTKARTITPGHPKWPIANASVTLANATQRCDIYLFASVYYRDGHPETCYLVGWMPADEFRRPGRSFKLTKGQIEDGFTVRADCINMHFMDLRSIESLHQKDDWHLSRRRLRCDGCGAMEKHDEHRHLLVEVLLCGGCGRYVCKRCLCAQSVGAAL